MILYEIEKRIADLIDPETGEVIDLEGLEALKIAEDTEIGEIGKAIIEHRAKAKALKERAAEFTARAKQAERAADYLEKLATDYLDGRKFETDEVVFAPRKSKKVWTDERFVGWAAENGAQYLRYKEPELDKKAITDALKAGIEVPYAALIESVSYTIK